MYETYYDRLQPHFGRENLHLQYMDTDSFVLCVTTNDKMKDIKNLEDMFDSNNLDEKKYFFSIRKKKVFGVFKISPKSFGFMNLFVLDQTLIHLYVETLVIVKVNLKVFLNLNKKELNLKTIKNISMLKNLKNMVNNKF